MGSTASLLQRRALGRNRKPGSVGSADPLPGCDTRTGSRSLGRIDRAGGQASLLKTGLHWGGRMPPT